MYICTYIYIYTLVGKGEELAGTAADLAAEQLSGTQAEQEAAQAAEKVNDLNAAAACPDTLKSGVEKTIKLSVVAAMGLYTINE